MLDQMMKYKDLLEHVQIVYEYYENAVSEHSRRGLVINDFAVYYEREGGQKIVAPKVFKEAIAESIAIHTDMIIDEAMNILNSKLEMHRRAAYEDALEFISEVGENNES